MTHTISKSCQYLAMAVLGLSGCALQAATEKGVAVDAVYVAPDGDDSRRGTAPADALRTLSRVQEMLKANELRIAGDQLTIRMMPGTYQKAGVTWDFVSPGHRIVIEPAPEGKGEFPVTIDGKGDPLAQFFLLRFAEPSSTPINTGIVIRRLRIANYCEGISLGNWQSKAPVTGNVIEGNLFERIGSKYEADQGGKGMPRGNCVAGIRLQQASGNVIRKNVFSDIENLPVSQTVSGKYGPTLLHAIYVSNASTSNRIEDNTFRRFSGSPIRIGAASNDNIVKGNTFESPVYVGRTADKYTISAVSQWYCNDAVPACKEKSDDVTRGCPSTGIEIANNRVGPGINLYADDSQSKAATCPMKVVPEAQRQPRLKDNVTVR